MSNSFCDTEKQITLAHSIFDIRFGVQVLGQDAVPVRLIPRRPNEQVRDAKNNAVSGVFLCRSEPHQQQEVLLFSSSALAYTRRFELKTGSKRLAICVTLLLQSAGAWVMIPFEEEV